MYWTTPSGTRYQTGSPSATRARQSVELIAIAGTSWSVTRSLGQSLVGQLVPGPGDADEVRQLPELLGVLPREDLGEGVGAGDEEQLVVGPLRPDVAQGVDRERRAGPVDVDPADGEARVGGRRDDGHEVAVLGGRDVAVGLLPRLPGGDEDDLVEVEARLDLAGGHEVTVVDRVERPTHDAEAHGQWWAPSDPLELPCVPSVGRAGRGACTL